MKPRLSVIGLGHLGLPLAGVLAAAGYNVIGVDSNPDVVKQVNTQQSPFHEPGLDQLLREVTISATTHIAQAVQSSDVTFVVVPTQSTDTGAFSMDVVALVVGQVIEAKRQKGGSERHAIVVVSTVNPGDMRALASLMETAYPGDSQCDLLYNPSFIALGSVIRNLRAPDYILIGEADPSVRNDAVDTLIQIHRDVTAPSLPPITRMAYTEAEITKLAQNVALVSRITFANEIARYCDCMDDVSARTVLNAIGMDTRIGSAYLAPGPPVGGPCLPRDSVALGAAFTNQHVPSGYFNALTVSDDCHHRWLARRIKNLVIERGVKSVGVIGLSYKPDTGSREESFGEYLISYLFRPARAVTATVVGFDPLAAIPEQQVQAWADMGRQYLVATSAGQCVQNVDAVVITHPTMRSALTLALVLFEDKKFVFDCWGVLRGLVPFDYEHYYCVGG